MTTPREGLTGSDEAIEAMARQLLADYDSEVDAGHLSWQDFDGRARHLLSVVEPFIAARVREAVAEERQRALTEAADEVRREARWQQEMLMRNVQPVQLNATGRLRVLEEILRARAAGSVPVATPEQSVRTEPYRACAGCDGPDLCRYCEYPVATPAEPDDREAATTEVRWAARVAENLCHWRQNYLDARTESHWAFHFGNPCPYEVVAAVLRGKADPRASAEPSVGTGTPAEAVSGGSGHAESPDNGNPCALLQRYVSNPAIRQRMLGALGDGK